MAFFVITSDCNVFVPFILRLKFFTSFFLTNTTRTINTKGEKDG